MGLLTEGIESLAAGARANIHGNVSPKFRRLTWQHARLATKKEAATWPGDCTMASKSHGQQDA